MSAPRPICPACGLVIPARRPEESSLSWVLCADCERVCCDVGCAVQHQAICVEEN